MAKGKKGMVLDQTSLIVIVVSFVVMLGGVAAIYFTKPEPETAPAAPTINTAEVQLPTASVVMTRSLRGSGGAGGTGTTDDNGMVSAGFGNDEAGTQGAAGATRIPQPESLGAGAAAQ
jgi:hypothetical protein